MRWEPYSFDYSKSQASEETGVSRVTLDKIWKELLSQRIIVKTRSIGRADMYKLNKENPRVKILQELSLKLASAFAEEEIGKIKRKIDCVTTTHRPRLF